jgi:bifunctional non-homologous end joining protein LigD
MPLASVSESFNHPDWIFEPKWDGFRGIAYIESGHCKLLSRRGYAYKAWPDLAHDLVRSVRCVSAVLDGELCCLSRDGRPQFYDLMFRRGAPFFMVFDLLWLNGRDLRAFPLSQRKAMLWRVLPCDNSRIRYVDHIVGRGVDLFDAACSHDLEGIVAKWSGGTYQSGPKTSWLKVRNQRYSQWDGRRDLFETRRDNAQRRTRWVKPEISLR